MGGFCSFLIMLLLTLNVYARNSCDVRPGYSLGVKVVEFVLGHVVISKIPFIESSPRALHEEMVSLQDMSLCNDTIISRKCVLKFEKKFESNYVTMYRGTDKWNTWGINSKTRAQTFVKGMKKAGFCL